MPLKFTISGKVKRGLGRAGVIETLHGKINTPAFAVVATKASVKAATPEMLKKLGAQVVLANTYHLHLEPGEDIVKKAGGLGKFMNWDGPTMTDSGGFQAFSLGPAYNKSITKLGSANGGRTKLNMPDEKPLAKIDDGGISFKSIIDGSARRFTPESCIKIQHDLGADIIFTLDECALPDAAKDVQIRALERTHRWAKRCLKYHLSSKNKSHQPLFGIIQGGRFEDLRRQSARFISGLDFSGFGIGGTFEKIDVGRAVKWVNEELPPEKPRHLLGIGEINDLFEAVRNGCDLFDCVLPTRLARNGSLYTPKGRINIYNSRYKKDLRPIDSECACYTCFCYSRAYLSHLFRAKEILAPILSTAHNLFFLIHLVDRIRESILDNKMDSFMDGYLRHYKR